MSATGDCFIGCCITYEGKQCKYNYGFYFASLICIYNHLVSLEDKEMQDPQIQGNP